MPGRRVGYITTQDQVVADLFAQSGYTVITASPFANRYCRVVDIAQTIVRHRQDFDILVINIYGGASFVVEDIASRLGRRFGKRIVMMLQGGGLPDFIERFPRWSRRVLERADAIVGSAFLARRVAALGFHTSILPNVVELAAYPYRHRATIEPRMFWMRSFHAVYNPAMAVRALARLRHTWPEASLVMAGPDKGLEPETRQLGESLALHGSLRFAGFLDGAGKTRESHAADVFLNTNDVDNMPVAVLEACAFGMPVVATAVGGVPDLLTDGETGLLIPPNDDRAMASAIARLLQEPGLAARLSAQGRELAERCSWTRVRPMWEELFASLAVASASHRGRA